ncbi:hypothetical protein PMAYCL1PPCAC_21634, partial [Pristionchus mayeri]
LLLSALPVCALGCYTSGYNTWMDGRCFRLTNDQVNYNSAQKLCAKEGTLLPAIKTAEENEEMHACIHRIRPNYPSIIWLGITCDGKQFVWPDGTQANYTNFAGAYECTASSTGRSYYLADDRRWHESNDGKAPNYLVAVCEEITLNAPCYDYELLELGDAEKDSCFKVQKQVGSWQEAEGFCAGEGAHLSVIHDQATNDFIRRTAVANGLTGGVHIGIQMNALGEYAWVDGSAIDFTNYEEGFPNDQYGTCAAMQTSFLPGKWMNIDCNSTKLPYVCAKPAVDPSPPPSVESGCPLQSIYAPGDEIFSPAFPQTPGESTCDYLLVVPDGHQQAEVEISFLEANLCCDTLTVYDGIFGSKILRIITGYNPTPVTIRSSSYAIRLLWNSTSGVNVRGFQAKMSKV